MPRVTLHTSSKVKKVKGQGHQATLGGCSSHHLQRARAYCVGRTTGRTACFCCDDQDNKLKIKTIGFMFWSWSSAKVKNKAINPKTQEKLS